MATSKRRIFKFDDSNFKRDIPPLAPTIVIALQNLALQPAHCAPSRRYQGDNFALFWQMITTLHCFKNNYKRLKQLAQAHNL